MMAHTVPMNSSLLIRNARIYTVNPAQPWAEAIAISNDRIVWVGKDAEAKDWIGPQTRVIDAQSQFMLPGLNDSHFHLLMGARALDGAQLYTQQNVRELQATVSAYAQSMPDRFWLRGRGWQYSAFADGSPIHRKWLDEILPDRPFCADAFDGHSAWANTKALELAGILSDASQDPTGFGEVVRDGAGLATGWLRESPAMDLVRNHIPQPTDDTVNQLLRRAIGLCHAAGLTSVQNMDNNAHAFEVFDAFDQRDELTLRVYLPMLVEASMKVEALEAWKKKTTRLGSRAASSRLRTGCYKFFMDGVVEAKTAFMVEPYADGSGERGTPNFLQANFDALATKADALGGQIFVHAIGDAAVRATLNGFEAALKHNGRRDSRHRIEHIEVLHPQDLPRFQQLGVLGSIQALHAEFGYDQNNPWLALLGPGRWAQGMAWRTLMNAGVPICQGSDWPVVSYDPRLGVQAAVTRRKFADLSTWHLEGASHVTPYVANHAFTLAETIAGYTSIAAFAEFQENEKGRLKPGLLADLVVLDANWFEIAPPEIAQTKVMLTVSGGKIVHEAI